MPLTNEKGVECFKMWMTTTGVGATGVGADRKNANAY